MNGSRGNVKKSKKGDGKVVLNYDYFITIICSNLPILNLIPAEAKAAAEKLAEQKAAQEAVAYAQSQQVMDA